MTVDIGPDFALCYQGRCFHPPQSAEKKRGRVTENEIKNEHSKEGIEEGRKEDINTGRKLFSGWFLLKK